MKYVVMLAIVLAATPSHADDAPYLRYYRAGKEAYRTQSFGAASQNFDEAYQALDGSKEKADKLQTLSDLAFDAAQAYRRQFRVEPTLELALRAVDYYRKYLARVKTGGRVRTAADGLGEMQREVDRLIAAGAKVAPVALERTRIGISPQLSAEGREGVQEIADVDDANAPKIVTLLDGKPVTPYELVDVAPGVHAVHVEADGYKTADASERALKGVSAVAEIVLVPKPAHVKIDTEHDAQIRVDGRAVASEFEVGAGKHVVAISRSGRESIAREIVVTRGEALALREPLEPTWQRRAVPWVAGTSALLGAGAISSGIYALVEDSRASNTHAAIGRGDQTPATAARYDQQLSRRNDAVTATWLLGGAALALAGGAAALYFLDSPADEHVHVVPAPGGLAVSGRF